MGVVGEGESEKTDCKAFSYQLIRYFVEILVEPKELRSAGEGVFERLKEMFKSYDINPPPNVHLVSELRKKGVLDPWGQLLNHLVGCTLPLT